MSFPSRAPYVRTALPACLIAGLAFTACDLSAPSARGDRTSQGGADREHPLSAAQAQAYAREMLDLKAGGTDPRQLEAAMGSLAQRYGFAEEEPAPPILIEDGSLFVDPAKLAHGDSGAASGREALPAAPGKVAAAASTHWYMAKDIDFGVTQAFKRSFWIPNGAAIHFWTWHDGSVSRADPMLVAFIEPFQDPNWPNVPVKLVGASDDDGGNLDADFRWKNNTGAQQLITVVAHAYARTVTGMGTLNFTCVDAFGRSCGGFSDFAMFFGGSARRGNTETPGAGCVGPTKSNISLYVSSGGGYGPVAVAVNVDKMRGGENMGGSTTLLADVLPGSGFNYLVGFTTSDGNAADGDYSAFQGNNYTCP